MIVFHEGLPGSGKSYEACVMHILPALKAGRSVLTNINGINHEKFSQLTGIPESLIRKILVCISHSDVDDEEERLEQVKQSILEKTEKDSLVVIDEIQDIHPSTRQKLSAEWSKYIASHRHEGLDIVLMGQDRRDVHPIWRRRIQRLITFNKLQAVGADNSYRWECFEATRPEKFKVVTTGIRKYDSQYFGLYSSHTQGTENKTLYKDARANVLNSKSLRWGIAAVIAMLVWAVPTISNFFKPNETIAVQEPVPVPPVPSPEPVQSVATTPPVQTHPERSRKSKDEFEGVPPLDVFDDDARRNRLRLTGFIQMENGDISARVDVVNSSGHRLDEYDHKSLIDLGWKLSIRDSGLHVTKEGKEYLIRPWPLDEVRGRVNRTQQESVASN